MGGIYLSTSNLRGRARRLCLPLEAAETHLIPDVQIANSEGLGPSFVYVCRCMGSTEAPMAAVPDIVRLRGRFVLMAFGAGQRTRKKGRLVPSDTDCVMCVSELLLR